MRTDLTVPIISKEEQPIKQEKVFEILGEGGGICIHRQINKFVEKFIYHHNEIDPTDEGLGVYKKNEYSNFEEPFQLINNKYPWYKLYVEIVHDDYRDFIIKKLVEKLNDNFETPDAIEFCQRRLEGSLKIKLIYSKIQPSNKFTWSCQKLM